MKSYCEGSHCSRRHKCTRHCVPPGEYEYIDWSTTGGGHTYVDEHGKSQVETWVDCGDEGNFKKFEEIAAYVGIEVINEEIKKLTKIKEELYKVIEFKTLHPEATIISQARYNFLASKNLIKQADLYYIAPIEIKPYFENFQG